MVMTDSPEKTPLASDEGRMMAGAVA
jgi:hypothetical protein